MADVSVPQRISVIGVDHHRTPIALRERLALATPGAGTLATALLALPEINEAVVLSTCNRLECYCSGTADRSHIVKIIAEHQNVDFADVDAHAFGHHDTDCIRHAFRVASGLESLVLGECQIVNQIKNAYESARQSGTTGPFLNPLFQRALAAGKDVRNRTAIGKHKLSVASVAVDLAKQVHGDLARARLLVIGAGEIAELAVTYLVNAGVKSITVINRSEDHAQELANTVTGFKPSVLPWDHLHDALADHDIIVSSTSAPHAVITLAKVRHALRKRQAPVVFLDLAVPRDIEAGVAHLQNVFLYNVDHLDAVVAAHRHLRSDDLDAAQTVITEHVASYIAEISHDRSSLLTNVATFFQDITNAEETRLKNKLRLQHDADHQEIRYGLERIGNKLQHRVLAYLRQDPHDPQRERIIRELLGL